MTEEKGTQNIYRFMQGTLNYQSYILRGANIEICPKCLSPFIVHNEITYSETDRTVSHLCFGCSNHWEKCEYQRNGEKPDGTY